MGIILLGGVVASADEFRPEDEGDAAFRGTITAVESTRNSFTVRADSGQVRMFSLAAAEKAKLALGQKVRVRYSNQYAWPLPTRGITLLGP